MKKTFIFLFGIAMIICSSLTSCDPWAGGLGGGGNNGGSGNGNTPVNNNCNWQYDKNAVFNNVELLLPCGNDCEYIFRNSDLETILNRYSLYQAMEYIALYYPIMNFELSWTVTIVPNKPCSNQSDQQRTITFDKNNYDHFISFNDILDGTPIVPDSCYFYPSDHLHTLVFQIFEIENTYDGKIGTMAWEYSWEGPSIVGDSNWEFIFPNGGIVGSFNSNTQQPGRYIYIHNQYELI